MLGKAILPTGENIQRCLPIMVAAFARDAGYTVRHVPSMEFFIDFDAKEITVPTLKAIGSDDDAMALLGGTHHECMHARETDQRVQARLQTMSPLLKALWNVIEDVRGENGYFVRYPGACDTIDEALAILRKNGFYNEPTNNDQPADVLAKFLNFGLRTEILGQQFAHDWVAPAKQLADEAFGPLAATIFEMAAKVVREERGKQGTWHSLDVAQKIARLLEDASKPSSPQAGDSGQPGTNGQQPDSQGAEASGPGDPQPSPSDPQSSSADRNQPDGHKESGTPSSPGQNANGASPKAGADSSSPNQAPAQDPSGPSPDQAGTQAAPPSPSQAKAAGKAIGAKSIGSAGKDLGELLKAHGGFTAKDNSAAIVPRAPSSTYTEIPGSSDTLHQNESRARRTALDLSLKLEDLLMAHGKVDVAYRRKGHFDDRLVVEGRLGRRDLYRVTAEAPALSTRVVGLIDFSGSMGQDTDGTKTWITNATVLGIGTVLDRCEVPFSLAGFNGDLYLIHRFEDAWRQTMTRFGYNGKGGTRIASPYVWAIEQLIVHDEERKIVLMISDGAGSDMDHLHTAVRTAQLYGVETRAVLISPKQKEVDAFVQMGCHPGIATSLDEIPQALFRTLESALQV